NQKGIIYGFFCEVDLSFLSQKNRTQTGKTSFGNLKNKHQKYECFTSLKKYLIKKVNLQEKKRVFKMMDYH
ncbi:hypothetical protein NS311_20265, partial [Pantoea ananatis]|uniref:hypothetical protein n=1 Tax=Pantoea ananas TaxID=553 RepID=UPI00079653D0